MNQPDRTQAATPIAIVGMDCLFPAAPGLREYWRLIRRAEDGVEDVPDTHWSVADYVEANASAADLTYCGRGAFLPTINFDPTEFGIPPTTLEAIDTSQLLSLMVAKGAMRDAGYGEGREFNRSKTSVILGVTGTQELVIPLGARLGHPIWRRAMRSCGIAEDLVESAVGKIADEYVAWQENSFPGLLGNVVAGRIANRLNLGGTNCVVDAACASSLSAVHLAMLELAAGRSDLAITGGVDTLNDIFMFMCFTKTQALSPTGDARPFSIDADGTVLGEGVGMVVLKRLADAQRDGDRIYAAIQAMGTSSDGRSQSIYSPRSAGQAEAMRDAYVRGGVDPATIELVEAHGTGTKVGDAAEFESLRTVYREARSDGAWCALGSVKSQIGHTKAAAGVAGLIKTALALHHKVLPPTIKISEPNPKLDIAASPFYLNTEPRPWIAGGAHARRAGVSAFGFGGSNFHAVLEEAPAGEPVVAWDRSVEIVALAAANRGELADSVREWRAFLDDLPEPAVLAYRAKCSRDEFRADAPCRLTIVIEHGADPCKLFDNALRVVTGEIANMPDAYFGEGAPGGKLVVLFPGQGSQYVGMGRDLACVFPELAQAIAAASAAGELRLGEMVYPPPVFDEARRAEQMAALTSTDVAQPAIGAVSAGMSRVLTRFGVIPELVAGHSYGELVALWAGGRIDENTLHRLSRMRGRLMAHGDGDRGTMAAVQAPLAEIEQMLSDERLPVTLAHRNSPTQGILAGSRDAVAQAVSVCESRGWRTTPLNVSGAFHTDLMADAGRRFRDELGSVEFAPGEVTVYANCTAEPYANDAESSRDTLARQLVNPVDFQRQIENMYAAGARTFVEAGPKSVLTGLVRATLADRPHEAIALDAAGGKRCGLADLARVLARLAAGGRSVSLAAWEPDAVAPTLRKMTIPLTGANYRAKPKPRREPSTAAKVATTVDRTENAKVTSDQAETRQTTSPTASKASPDVTRPASPAVAPPAAVAQSMQAPATPAASTPPVQPGSPVADGVLEVVREGLRAMQAMQQQTAAAHQRFLETQEQSQKTFQMVMESQQRLVEATLGMAPSASLATAPVMRQPPAPPSSSGESPSQRGEAASDQSRDREGANRTATTPHPVAATPSEPSAGQDHLQRILVEVVSETTGYPSDAIGLEMDLEDDLGIDRVGRVHLLARLGERVEIAHPLNGSQADRLKTLHDIVAYCVTGGMPDEPAQPAAAPESDGESLTGESAAGEAAPDNFEPVLLEVVAELTGYPVEMIEPDMDLEADLGIDSIKRVEILAEVQTRIPNMAAMNSSYAGSLRTLRNIIDYMNNPDASGSSEKPKPQPAMVAPTTPATAASAGEPAASAPMNAEQLDRRVLRAVELEPTTDAGQIAIAPGREIWIVDDGSDLPAALGDVLKSRGITSRVVGVDGETPSDIEHVGGLIYLGRPNQTDANPWNESAETDLKRAFALAKRVGPALAESAAGGGAPFATVSRMDGSFGLGGSSFDPAQGGLAGLAKTAAQEWPGVTCKALDVAATWTDAAAIAEAILAELGHDGPIEIGFDARHRRGLEAASAGATPTNLNLNAGDLVIVTGGARGVTAETVVALAHACRPTLVLLGRSPAPQPEPEWLAGLRDEAEIKRALMEHTAAANGKPKPAEIEAAYARQRANREITANLERIQAAGARVLYRSLDLRDGRATRDLIADLKQEFGPLRAIIHGAGVIEDRLISDKTPEQFDRVFDTKVAGLRNLLAAVDADELRQLVLFSSVSGRFGRTGQVDYAMANEVLNKAAQRFAAQHPSCRVCSINWGPWAGGMVTPSLKRDFERQGIGLIPLDAGAAALVAEMNQSNAGAAEVIIGASWPEHQQPTQPAMSTNIADTVTAGAASSPLMTVMFERRLDVERHNFLNSHRIDDQPVLPVAIMLEWLGHAALHDNPGLLLHGFDDFRVLSGVVLRDGPRDLHVAASKAALADGFFHVDLELRSETRGILRRHASARAILAPTLPDAPQASATITNGAPGLEAREVYGGILFHGPDFHAIKKVHAISRDEASASVRAAPAPAMWMDDPPRSAWLADPLVLDAALQLGILWCHRNLDSVALPTAGRRYRQYRSPFASEEVAVVLTARDVSANRLTADVTLIGADSRVLAVMEGFEWTAAASLSAAFARETVAGAGS